MLRVICLQGAKVEIEAVAVVGNIVDQDWLFADCSSFSQQQAVQ